MLTAKVRRSLVPALMVPAVLFGLPASSPAQDANARPNVMLVLDSSGSMWGQIDGVNKVVSARNVVATAAKRFEGKVNLGIVSFGHRQSSSCSDIELLLDPGTHKAAQIASTVNAIKPKGSTPIAASLIKAAEAARYKEQPVSVILIADGLDNCSADPCATAQELKQQASDFKVHTIAFDAKKKLAALSCIAENTGGTFAMAANEEELAEHVDAAFTASAAAPAPRVAAAAQRQPQPQTTTQPYPDPQVTTPLPAPKPYPEPQAETESQTPQQAMPKSDSLTASPEPQAGQPRPAPASGTALVPVTLSARTVEGGAIIKSGLVWWIYKNAKTKDGKYKLVETLREATPTAALPPGPYRIAATYGKANLIRDLNVERGRAIQETFILNAGGLRLNAVTHTGAAIPPNSVRYDIFADETESDQFGNRKIVLRDAKPGVVLRLNAGAYHVVSTYGDANAVVRADVAVESGRLTDATINHSASKVTLKLVTQPGGEALADTQWNILTPGGDVVKESAGALPTHILAPGTYTVLAHYQGRNFTREFSVEPGETKQIEVVIQ